MEDFDWTTQNECYLFESMSGHKPVGINKAFQMACIFDKFKERIEKELPSQALWTHLGTMYNLEALDENESLPFPNDEVEFELPDMDFANLKESKLLFVKEDEQVINSSSIKDSLKNDLADPQRRDSKDSHSSSTSSKKDKDIMKKESEKTKKNKSVVKGDTPKAASTKNRDVDTPGKPSKRPTRGSLKADDSSSSGKSSPVTVIPTAGKKRRSKQ